MFTRTETAGLNCAGSKAGSEPPLKEIVLFVLSQLVYMA